MMKMTKYRYMYKLASYWGWDPTYTHGIVIRVRVRITSQIKRFMQDVTRN